MSHLENIQQELNRALRAGDKQRVGALRLIKAEIARLELETRAEISEEDFWKLLAKMRKQRSESIHQFEKADRQDLASKERFEQEVIESFLPPQLSQDELRQLVHRAISATDAKKPQDIGRVMAHLKADVQGRADMRQLSQYIKSQLNQS